MWSIDVAEWRATPDAAPINLQVTNTLKWNVGTIVDASISPKNFTLTYQ